MGQPAARITDMHTCPMVTGLVPHVGGPVSVGSPNVLTGSLPQARVTDMAVCIGPPDVIANGSATVLIIGLPAARMGDSTVHGGVITLGCPTVLIGDAGGGGGGTSAFSESAKPLSSSAPATSPVPAFYGKSIKIEGSPEFQAQVKKDIEAIAKTSTGKKLLDAIENSGKSITIKKTVGGNSVSLPKSTEWRKTDGKNAMGTDSTVNYNPDRKALGTQEWETRPPAIGLAHELVHAQHAAEGSIDTSPVPYDSKPDPTDPKHIVKEKQEEVRTTGIPPYDDEPYSENKIRAEWDPKQLERKWY
jgi:uncharacterized Zn-binding protein involved in type VI secretion